MKEETKNKIAALTFENLPDEFEGFTLHKTCAVDEDKFIFFSYVDEVNHTALTVYFHEETMEFKVREKIGLTEFCLTKFFTQDFEHFKEMIDAQLATLLKDLHVVRTKAPQMTLCRIVFNAWRYGNELPATLEGFELFIRPAVPVKITNGSYIVINYVDFAANSDFTIYYNVLSEEFSGESRINGALKVTYIFDTREILKLQAVLEKHLISELQAIRRDIHAKK